MEKVAIIGRANTGKSTLFNCLLEQKKAIVSGIAGTTRDRNFGQAEWRGQKFYLIDTGGLDLVHDPAFEKDVVKQAKAAIQEADLILLMVDVKAGLMPQDKMVANLLRKSQKKIILVLNKADTLALKKQTADFYRLGLGEPIPVSALNGTGTGDLLDIIVKNLKSKPTTSSEQQATNIRIAIIGKPNVGKSSLVNAILGEERVITSPVPYTTRDAQDIDLIYQNQNYTLVDTAGLRKRTKVAGALERFSAFQALKTIGQSDVIMLITDVSLPLGNQDQALADLIMEKQKSLVIVANKWDLIEEKMPETIEKFTGYYRRFLPFLNFAPIIFTSALEKQRVKKILTLAKEIYAERFRQITENALDKFLKNLLKKNSPKKGRGARQPKIYGLKQIGVNPPRFELVKDYRSDIHRSYLKFMENKLREKFGFFGAPVIIRVRKLT